MNAVNRFNVLAIVSGVLAALLLVAALAFKVIALVSVLLVLVLVAATIYFAATSLRMKKGAS